MADNRRLRFFCGASGLGVLAAVIYVFFDQSPGSAQRADRIDFSSLSTVVSFEDYSLAEAPEANAGRKHHRVVMDLPPLGLATAADAKADYGTSTPSLSKLPALLAKHTAKLQQHLEEGLTAQASPAKGVAPEIVNGQPTVLSSAQLPAVEKVSNDRLPAVVKISTTKDSLGQGLGLSSSGNRSSGRRGPLSGLLR